LPYLPDNRQFKRRHQSVHVEAPTIHLSGHGGHVLMWLGIALLLTAGMVYLGRMVYLLDQDNADGDQETVEFVVDELQLKIAQVELERDALSQSVATLERAAQVDKIAQREVQEELIALQEERNIMKQELTILKRVAGKIKGAASVKSAKKSTGKKRSRKKKKINKTLPAAGKKKGGF
jgi:hypothetical protein